MSTDLVLFHSSEADDPHALPTGWYIGFPTGDTLTTDGAQGPFETRADAAHAAASGAYLRERT